MPHKDAHRHRRHFPDLPIVIEQEGDNGQLIDVVNRLRETVLIMLGDKERGDQIVDYEALAGLGLVDPLNHLPRKQPLMGLSHGRISATLNTTIATSAWTSLPFGTIDIINTRLFKSDGSGLELRVTGEYLLSFAMPLPVYTTPVDLGYTVALRMLINGGGATEIARVMANELLTLVFAPARVLSFDADDVITFEFTHDNATTMTIDEPYTLDVFQLNADPVQPWASGIKQP